MLIIFRRYRVKFYIILLILFLGLSFSNKKFSFLQRRTNLFSSITLDCTDEPLKFWCQNQIHRCNSSVIIFNKLFVRTNSLFLNIKHIKGKRRGGEELQKVLNQSEEDEYFHFDKGFIQSSCNNSFPLEVFTQKNHLFKIFSSLTIYSKTFEHIYSIKQITIAVHRYDYVNFYHTITDLYNVYLLCRFFTFNPKFIRILFLDAHPKGNLDRIWSQLFHSYTRLGQLNHSKIFFDELIWSPIQSKSEIDVDQDRTIAPSYFFDFRQYILEQFDIHSNRNEKINCQHINIFFLLRRNYIAHARNPSGTIQRQLLNENEIIKQIKNYFQNNSFIHFDSNYFEHLSFEKQLQIISQTDILLGMHGAGLTHVIFLKLNRILIELSTADRQMLKHFERMSSINQINYHRCRIENGQLTTGNIILNCLTKKLLEICPNILS